MELIDREKLKEKKVYSAERKEYVVPVAEIDWQPTVNTWISVEDRYTLPKCKGCKEHSIEIIARDKDGKCRDCVYWFEHDIFEEEDGTILENIVAYMPIPEYSKGSKKMREVKLIAMTEESFNTIIETIRRKIAEDIPDYVMRLGANFALEVAEQSLREVSEITQKQVEESE